MDWNSPDARLAYAQETHRLALELWDYIFPPWRWPEWFRRRRVIRARIDEFRRNHPATASGAR